MQFGWKKPRSIAAHLDHLHSRRSDEVGAHGDAADLTARAIGHAGQIIQHPQSQLRVQRIHVENDRRAALHVVRNGAGVAAVLWGAVGDLLLTGHGFIALFLFLVIALILGVVLTSPKRKSTHAAHLRLFVRTVVSL